MYSEMFLLTGVEPELVTRERRTSEGETVRGAEEVNDVHDLPEVTGVSMASEERGAESEKTSDVEKAGDVKVLPGTAEVSVTSKENVGGEKVVVIKGEEYEMKGLLGSGNNLVLSEKRSAEVDRQVDAEDEEQDGVKWHPRTPEVLERTEKKKTALTLEKLSDKHAVQTEGSCDENLGESKDMDLRGEIASSFADPTTVDEGNIFVSMCM